MYRVGLRTGKIYDDDKNSLDQITECCNVRKTYSESVELSAKMPDPMCYGCPRFGYCGKESHDDNQFS